VYFLSQPCLQVRLAGCIEHMRRRLCDHIRQPFNLLRIAITDP
jgi:hypothetical protein